MLENGSDVWSACDESDPVSLSSRYEVLKRANKRCELCGVEDGDEDYDNRLPLHVDHIVPRSKGGSNEIQNLQVLFMACTTPEKAIGMTQTFGQVDEIVIRSPEMITNPRRPSQ